MIKNDKRVSSRAVIIKDDKIVLMFRHKDEKDKNYYTYPGGGVEENEDNLECVVREVKEEFSLDVAVLGYLGMIEDEKIIEHYYHCEIIGGEMKLGGEEALKNTKENYYEIRLVDLDNIENIDLRPKEMIEKAVNNEYI